MVNGMWKEMYLTHVSVSLRRNIKKKSFLRLKDNSYKKIGCLV